MFFVNACSPKKSDRKEYDNFVFIEGGTFINTKSNLYGKNAKIEDFYIGKFEITQKEWAEIMGNNPSKFKGDHLPVETVSWYDCVEYCNKRSVKEKLMPFYNIEKTKKDLKNKNTLDNIKWVVTINPQAKGYRLPTEAEWEYAAGGGQKSKSYKYSGGNDINTVAWFWQNAGKKALAGVWSWSVIENNNNKPKPVGIKASNELGIFDMSGNVREWCEDWFEDAQTTTGISRVWRGGGWMGGDFCCESSFRGNHQANGNGADQGLRVCRNK
jgi:formylglycine-generating enzyme